MCSPMCIFAYNYDAQQNILIIGCSLFQNAILFCSILASEFNNVHDAKKVKHILGYQIPFFLKQLLQSSNQNVVPLCHSLCFSINTLPLRFYPRLYVKLSSTLKKKNSCQTYYTNTLTISIYFKYHVL